MASIDRYRPPREGYQPPALPGSSRADGPSRSPVPPREIPPAAPTPPQNSARTSPPRPQTQPQPQSDQQSPAQSGHNGQGTVANQWSFTSAEVLSTPSIIDGIPPSEERLRRAKGVNFIYQAGVMLDLPQITLWVAGVFFHRFFMRFSMVQDKGGIHHYNIAATALFLANKVEENCRKTKEIIIAVAKVAQKNAKLEIDEQSKEYWRWRDSILTYEEIMLEQLTFDLMIDNPYRQLFELLGQLDIVHNKNLRQAAWAFCNDACLTAIPLLIEARDVAISAIFFASVHTRHQIDDINGEPWWRYLNGDEERCTSAIEVMRQFYTENPLRKQNPSLPSPAFDLENTRRRAETLPSQPDTLSSNGTPTELDRASRSRSPAPRANGADRGDGSMPRSPVKRKDADPDGGAEHGRSEKRAKVSEDEGELVED
ncbi:cyclin [Metarhizium album ARSEF 1941]|uniref:RNA polymerase II holoenzyme cyclin-like subunit n=1 Tax=Metarhizium album (strain ARSEF 1941) TaxID=1081103 RepID=A0A0B2X3R7_METAS|nr:cyclin [Metarhizium album ARSEF 1941]KHO00070.1 cyclin [Metarhizium album ARSEF 1941]